jgi:hypothetical protein
MNFVVTFGGLFVCVVLRTTSSSGLPLAQLLLS